MTKDKRTKARQEKDNEIPGVATKEKTYTQKEVDEIAKDFNDHLEILHEKIEGKHTPEMLFTLALAKFQSEMPTVERNKTVSFKNVTFNYADLAQIWEKMKKPLTKYGFSILQPIQHEEGTNYLYTVLSHCEGKSIQSKMRLDCVGNDIKAMGSAITYYRRYALCSLVGIVSDDDVNDSDIADGESPYIKALSAVQLKVIEDTLSDAKDLKNIIASLYGDLNKIPEENFHDVLKTITDFKANNEKKDFLRTYGMDLKRTEYHDYIDFLVDQTGREFDFILDKAVQSKDEFIENFNKWKNEVANGN